jgi:hypothetical protein
MIVYADPDQTPTALTLQDNPETPTSGLRIACDVCGKKEARPKAICAIIGATLARLRCPHETEDDP